MKIEVRELEKSFGEHPVLSAVSLEVHSGEMLALLGPSGCGKTTLLRIIAGLEFADAGQILFDGEDVTGRTVRERGLGFVFQHFALFRHLTVFENVAFGLRVKPRRQRPSGPQIRARVQELLRLVRLEPQARHLPAELSGGQRQRVALARALAVDPRVLLLDEPFGSLDAQVRRELRGWMRRLHRELQLTSVLVTHDQEEALEVADRVAVMQEGRIVQIGTPEEVYRRPASSFVYHFLGNVNVFHGRIEAGSIHLGDARLEPPGGHGMAEGPISVFVRPHHVDVLSAAADASGPRARVRHINAAGPTVKIELLCHWGQTAAVEISHERYEEIRRAVHGGLERGSEVSLRIRPEHLYLAGRDESPPERS